jgi:hypothetical protein
MHTKKRTKRVIGYCWCGGRLFKDGRNATRCDKCDRIKIVSNQRRWKNV